jgi:hypothetical protein
MSVSTRAYVGLVTRWLCVLCALGVPVAAARGGPVILFTADTEGHVSPCTSCPGHPGLGGLARRQTVVAREREAGGGAVLLVDGGNFLVGAESLETRGKVIVDAYNALRYDAVNLSPRDFRLGKAETLAVLKDASFAVVSANLLDAEGGGPLVSPYVVKEVGGKRVGITGVSEPPAGMDFLPHLKEQLAGIRVEPVAEALSKTLPKVKGESDVVVVLYYGSPTGLRTLREKFSKDVSAVLAGGIRPEVLPSAEGVPVAATSDHGRHLARLTLADEGHGVSGLQQIVLDDSVRPDAEMQKRVDRATAQPLGRDTEDAAAVAVAPPEGETAPPPRTLVRPKVEALKPAQADAKARPPEMAAGDPPAPPAERKDAADSAAPKKPVTVATKKPQRKKGDEPARVAAKQPHEPKGLAGVGLTPEQVNEAIDRGVEFLWDHVKTEHLAPGGKLEQGNGELAVACLALVHAGAHKRFPDFDAELRGFIARVGPAQFNSGVNRPGYWVGVYCMLVEAYGDATFMPQLTDGARYLVEAQGPTGTWSYFTDVPLDAYDRRGAEPGKPLVVSGGNPLDGSVRKAPPWKRRTPWDEKVSGDNSVSQFALLGLNAASRAGIKPPPEAWERNLERYRARQCSDGGWAYEGQNTSYGSMTCAGVCAVAVNRHELGEPEPAADEAVERGLAWLADKFRVDHNPGYPNLYHYYYLYSLERVGQIVGTEFIGPHEWYPLGARYLVDNQQRDGSWDSNDSDEPILPTSYALLFLKRATPSLKPDLPRGGEGLLRTAASAPPGRVLIILDCSGSMLVEMDGRPKFEAAREAVAQLIDALPEGTQVGLRVYGHRKHAREPGADEDTQLLLPIARLKKAEFQARLKSLRARGKTPLARSLGEALGELGSGDAKDPVTVVLLTDGGEDTQARPRLDPVKPAAQYAGREGVTLHVVGFDINRPDWTQQLKDIAAAAGGRYWPAERGDVLARNLRAAVIRTPERFTVFDAAGGAEVARGKFGESKKLKEGKYRLRTAFAGRAFEQELWINTAATTSVTFDGSAMPSGAAPAAAEDADKPTRPAAIPAARRFCTDCGKPLTAAARFCPACGAAAK